MIIFKFRNKNMQKTETVDGIWYLFVRSSSFLQDQVS